MTGDLFGSLSSTTAEVKTLMTQIKTTVSALPVSTPRAMGLKLWIGTCWFFGAAVQPLN
jgi:hypothetical protein